MKKYDKYKDSGIDWIGEIPVKWTCTKLKFHTRKIIDGAHFTPTYIENGVNAVPFLRVTDLHNSEIDVENIKFIPREEHEELIKRCRPEKGDLLLSKNGTIGLMKIVDWDWEFSIFVSLCLLKFENSLENRFFKFFFDSNIVDRQLFESSQKTSVTNLHLEKIKELRLTLPPKHEQIAISNYLDHKTAQIDDLISKKERLIHLLEEERTAIINQAVTKGLDPNVPMKDSGINWLGEIPEHWEVKKLRFLADIIPSGIDKKSKEEEEEVLLCNYVDVYKNDFITPNMEFMKATASDAQIEKLTLKKYDVIATKDSEDPNDIGVPALVLDDMNGVVCGYHLTLFRAFDDNEFGRFLFWFLKSKMCSQYFSTLARGITRYALGSNAFKNLTISLPMTKTEIHKIANYLDVKTKEIETIILNTKQEIELLKEYKTALISEVVTGKVDVRNVIINK